MERSLELGRPAELHLRLPLCGVYGTGLWLVAAKALTITLCTHAVFVLYRFPALRDLAISRRNHEGASDNRHFAIRWDAAGAQQTPH